MAFSPHFALNRIILGVTINNERETLRTLCVVTFERYAYLLFFNFFFCTNNTAGPTYIYWAIM